MSMGYINTDVIIEALNTAISECSTRLGIKCAECNRNQTTCKYHKAIQETMVLNEELSLVESLQGYNDWGVGMINKALIQSTEFCNDYNSVSCSDCRDNSGSGGCVAVHALSYMNDLESNSVPDQEQVEDLEVSEKEYPDEDCVHSQVTVYIDQNKNSDDPICVLCDDCDIRLRSTFEYTYQSDHTGLLYVVCPFCDTRQPDPIDEKANSGVCTKCKKLYWFIVDKSYSTQRRDI